MDSLATLVTWGVWEDVKVNLAKVIAEGPPVEEELDEVVELAPQAEKVGCIAIPLRALMTATRNPATPVPTMGSHVSWAQRRLAPALGARRKSTSVQRW